MAVCGYEFEDGNVCWQPFGHMVQNVPHLRYLEGKAYWENRRAEAKK